MCYCSCNPSPFTMLTCPGRASLGIYAAPLWIPGHPSPPAPSPLTLYLSHSFPLTLLLFPLLHQAAGTADDPYAFMPKPEENNKVGAISTGLRREPPCWKDALRWWLGGAALEGNWCCGSEE